MKMSGAIAFSVFVLREGRAVVLVAARGKVLLRFLVLGLELFLVFVVEVRNVHGQPPHCGAAGKPGMRLHLPHRHQLL